MTDKVRAKDIGAAVGTGHSTGEFASRTFTGDDVTLSLTGGTGWDAAVADPTHDQVTRARAAAERHLSFNKNATNADLEEITRQKAVVIAEQEAAYTAWKAGDTHPDDEMYNDIWEGVAPGVSRTDAETKLARALNARDNQDATALADRPLGYRNSALAQEHLHERIALYQEALRCDGRNLSVNQANVRKTKRAADQIPF